MENLENKEFLLSQIRLFDELPMSDIKVIDHMSVMRPVKRGTLILSPLQQTRALFLLKKGQVRLYRANEQGRQFTIDILTDGNVFGQTESFSLTDDDTYVEAMLDTYLCVMAKEQFEVFLAQRPELAMKLLSLLSERLRYTCDLSQQIALADVKSRVLYLLLRLSDRAPVQKGDWRRVNMRLTHADVATMVGASRETVSLVFSELRKTGVLKKRLLSYMLNAEKARKAMDLPDLSEAESY